MANGKFADIVVRTAGGLEIYEIKTSLIPRECVRQALGQLFEYGCWPGSDPLAQLWIVGPKDIDEMTSKYLRSLRSTYDLPLNYLCQPDKCK